MEKVSFFKRLINFIAGFQIKRTKRINKFNSYSRFKQYLLELEKGDEAFSYVSYAADLCDEALGIVRKRLLVLRKLKSLGDKIAEVECYNNLTEEDTVFFKDLLARIVSLSDERKQLMYQVTGFDSSLTYLIEYVDEVPVTITRMEEAETKQRILRTDIAMLEGEKSDLEYELQTLNVSGDVLYKFTIFSVALFAVITFTLAFLAIFSGTNIFFALSVMSFTVIFLTVIIYILRRRIRYEIQVNLKKQKRAVELLNTKNAVYASHTNFLRFSCKKYKVRSAEMLKKNLKDFTNYKHLTGRLDSITNILFQTEKQLDDFLRSKNIKSVAASSVRYAKTLDIEDKKRYYNDLMREKEALETSLNVVEARHEEIWEQLVELNNNDKTKDNIIERIIQTYLDEVGRMVSIATEAVVDSTDSQVLEDEELLLEMSDELLFQEEEESI